MGLIGLGLMGKPMAKNLLKAGFDLTVMSRSEGPVIELETLGAKRAESYSSLGAVSEFVVTMLPTPAVTKEVVLGPGGVLGGMKPNSILIDMGTEDPALAREIYERAKEIGVSALDAPVSGGDVGAIAGTLSIMVGGDRDVFERSASVLGAMGTNISYVGGAGSGQAVKAVNQVMVAGILATIAEGLTLLERSSVDTEAALEALMAGRAGSNLLKAKARQILDQSYAPGFKVDLHLKDLGIVEAYARENSVVMPFTQLAKSYLEAVSYSGGGELDHCALVEVVRGLGDLSLG
ncbi:NAD(P)-dependent oxidoreductase [Ferrithrix thermotolerans]|uniref:NAD(P)-dependent oxidoreductase n=1 Tax=Ferrithrix thermotolerans TaxID=209649 RepID=UPI001FEB1685|nr:NAD(P)-dependent oxidoreductase [Ferrithrix thermotolerans]